MKAELSVNRQVDPVILVVIVGLVGLGLVMVYSSSAVFAAKVYGSSSKLVVGQTWRILVGAGFFVLGVYLPRSWLLRAAIPVFFVACGLCALTLIPGIGHEAGGARRWLTLWSLRVQPSEFAKLAIVILLASAIARRQERQARGESLVGPLVLIQLPVALILAEPDFGTALVVEAIALTMIFIGGLPLRYVFGLSLLGLPMGYSLLMESYRLKRIIAWLDPLEYRASSGYQLTEALISIGTGGSFGVGLGESRQKLFFLPEAHTDFVFAIYAEELGFFGVLVLLVLYGTFIVRGTRLARRTDNAFDHYLAMGIVAFVAIPTVFNLWVVTGLLPTKGLPLPLMSYGGSNVVATLAALGILVGISRNVGARGAGV